MKLTVKYGFKGQLARIVNAALRDNDRVAMLKCGEIEQRPDFALVVIKGHQEIEAFLRWAEAQRLLTPGQESGMLDALEPSKRRTPKSAATPRPGGFYANVKQTFSPPATTHWQHVAIAVDIDRFTDAKLRNEWLPMFRQLGCETPQDIRDQCAEARTKGLEVFPPCHHTGPTGVCLGHSESESS